MAGRGELGVVKGCWGAVAVLCAAVKELTEGVHCRQPSVVSGVINLKCPMVGNREDEMAGLVALQLVL